MMNKKIALFLFLSICVFDAFATAQFELIRRDKQTQVTYNGTDPVVKTAIDMLLDDARRVSEQGFINSRDVKNGGVIVGVAGKDAALDQLLSRFKVDISAIKGEWEAFKLQVVQEKNESYLLVIGSDPRGTAYGVLELSRLIGVSPWVWWADVSPGKRDEVALPLNYYDVQKPSVQYRGIFLNDEDWGLMPWSSMTYEPSDRKGQIGPKTYSRIFELLLRLRANTLWPAMHEVTIPFYFTPGNKEAAAKYGILLGTSHCEPLMRNSAREWDVSGKGDYNYVTNRQELLNYWAERLQELQGAENIFTIGLRGKHDGMMQGVKTLAEHKAVLSQVLPDQRELLKKYTNPDPTKVPQVFIPYKEVLDVYNDGLDVPEDVTMVWCDDNYGYIKHFPDETERARNGGNGLYYHVSYWGRPHDYLWLSTINPALLHQQMSLAYDKGVRKLWIVNVGDIKPAEYQTELFLDMAWDIEAVNKTGVSAHLLSWLEGKFGEQEAKSLLPIMNEYYRLAYIRKPEHMGNTRMEEQDPHYKIVKDLDWNEEEIRQRINDYVKLSDQVEEIARQISPAQQSAYFQLVKYPVQAAAQMNQKLLQAQLARHDKGSWNDSHRAFDSIVSLTARYNGLEDGKWNRIMDYKPRNLAVYQKIPEEKSNRPLVEQQQPKYSFNAEDFDKRETGARVITGLGYSNRMLSLPKGGQVSLEFTHDATDSLVIEVRLLPNHAVDGKKLRFGIAVDDQPMQEVSYKTEGRSEEWKRNVLRNQAIRVVKLPVGAAGKHRLQIKALDEGVVLDQVMIF
ncbi:glycosyl hydrolase 115 family protein [Sphingobacterium pedocola]|nr:glycosyl hydrolase 115 family protein [Sphingobacterium pedocola]